MPSSYVVSIDLGTTNAKAAIVDVAGNLLATASGTISLIHVGAEGVEQDPEEVWNLIKSLVKQVVHSSAVPPSQITGIISTANYCSIVPVDATGQPTTNIIVHLDGRSTLPRLKKLPGFRADNPWQQIQWIRRAGLPPLSSGVDTLSRMRLIKFGFPEAYARTKTLLEPTDFLTMRFSGRHTASQCTAAMMLGINNNQHGQLEYDPKLIRMSQIDVDRWPQLVGVNCKVGVIRPELASELGLAPETKVFSGVTDTQASAIGTGAFSGTHAALGIGTTGVMMTHYRRRRTDFFRGLISMPGPIANTYLVLGEGGLAGKVIEYILKELIYAKDGFADHASNQIFQQLDKVLASVPAGSNGLLFLPWLAGMVAPKSEPSMRGAVLNLDLTTTRAEVARAAVEGMMFHLHWIRQNIEAFTKRRLTHFVLYGGGSKSTQMSQILADVSGIPVHQIADEDYVGVRGAAFLTFIQQGLMTADQIADKIHLRSVLHPNPDNVDIYKQRYTDFRLAFKHSRPLFNHLNGH